MIDKIKLTFGITRVILGIEKVYSYIHLQNSSYKY